MAVTIRGATEQDFSALSDLWRQADAFHAAALPGRFRKPVGDARPREFVAGELARPDAALFVAEAADDSGGRTRVVGFVRVTVHTAPDVAGLVPRRYAMVQEVAVDEAHRSRGIGRALLQRAHAWAAERGASEVELSVFAFNVGAIALYERLGYVVTSQRMTRPLA